MSQHPGRGLFPAVKCIPAALQPSPRLGSTLPKGGWHNDSPSKVSAIRLTVWLQTYLTAYVVGYLLPPLRG